MQEKQSSQQHTPVLPFDFTNYLDRLLGPNEREIESLQGGAANYIVRARLRKSTTSTHITIATDQDVLKPFAFPPDTNSVIIKQAPPFLAKSPEIAFSPYRQACHPCSGHTFVSGI